MIFFGGQGKQEREKIIRIKPLVQLHKTKENNNEYGQWCSLGKINEELCSHTKYYASWECSLMEIHVQN